MDKYYYFVSQLPVLFFDQESYMSTEYFLQEAEKWLSAKDFRTLSAVDINDFSLDKKCPQVLKQYKQFEFNLRNDLALWRKAQRMGQEYKPVNFPVSVIKEGNPLEIEKKLLLLRWNLIEEKQQEHHFDLEFLILYFLKLQILDRLSSFNKEKGQEIFQKISKVDVWTSELEK
ncbi:hypothetical protein DRQ15_01760 [candidate division KSB1 bacterium]|nr:MAG: hypothetical protein DRQ12_00300 [candidate division KSB1 bacterium]RKY86562.1 MAG: hypothetical protein DRP98_00050 [candidate division KSB1 bacterium]RKY89067.1 MAG: hypothetical protein DRQ11_02070 [candidate division KSB1 bacterium]RKY92652.1 MAG: hypothetical protein DRQ15_01760 [candidate division KSB1 bacterium]